MKYLYSILLLALLASCSAMPENQEQELYSYLEGTFTSERQSAKDSTYYDITLNMSPVWPEKDGLWIYVEQALTDAPQNPYAQKIYELSKNEQGKLFLKPYDIEHPERFHGGWEDASLFESLSPEDLKPVEGCELYFEKEGEKFVGSTQGKNCHSLTANSKYTTTQFTVSEGRLVSWSRGYAADDTQVWGKSEGGYILEKVQ